MDAQPTAGSAGARRAAPMAVMCAAIVGVASLAYLGDRRFFLADDTAGAWLPVSRRIGGLLRAGESHLMDPDLWRGGNFVASARYGVWNPLVLLLDVSLVQLDDLALVAYLVSLFYLLALGVGCYLLSRDYGALPWPSAVAGVVAASGGWTLWLDAAWWTPHLASLACAPWVWWLARRCARGTGSPAWFIAVSLLCVTIGNPYSAIVIVVLVVAVVVEFGDRHRPMPVIVLAGSLAAIGLVALFVYLPFQQTAGLGPRETGLFNDERWALGAGDLLRMSTPTARPYVALFNPGFLGFPGVYLSWFVLPLAPWMRWRVLGGRDRAGLAVVAATFGLLCLGPSNAWFFRWPIRLLPYLYLAITIAAAVVLSAGLVTDRWRRRAFASAAIVAGGSYLAWADVPDDIGWHLAGAVVVSAALAITVRLGRGRTTWLGVVLISATLAVLALQLQWRPTNESVSEYRMPTSATVYERNFANRYEGTVVQIATVDAVPIDERTDDGAYRDLSFGSTYAIADVATVSAYSALGFVTHDDALCLFFDGRMCADAWNRLWQQTGTSATNLADRIGADTVVVQRALLDTAAVPAPPGWRRDEVTEHVVVWVREQPRAWPAGRLTAVDGPVEVSANVAVRAHHEEVRFVRTGDGAARLTFARLAWPGYTAAIDGRAVPIGGDEAGLLTVDIPADVGSGEVVIAWVPPYWRPSLAVAMLGLVVAVVVQLVWIRFRRRGATAGFGEDGSAASNVGETTPE